ncbi:hypothetical protein ACL02T_18860 [Pseudonocardia sp. RS010]|uniref:hypothetical protein n=1 Tax=Pseudonocardia sp. RS010 TaxID=3385979 RepID=UPI0039A38F3D
MDRPSGSDEPRERTDVPEPGASPEPGEDAATGADGDATTIVPAERAAPPSETGATQTDLPTTNRTPGRTGSPPGIAAPYGGPVPGGATPGTGFPAPTPPSGSDAPHYPGQRYPAVPGRAGEPEIPAEQPWGVPPPYAAPGPSWAPPPGQPREQRTGRWIAGLSTVILLTLAAIGGGAWFLVTALSGPSVPAGYQPITTPYLTYAVPGDWTPLDGVAARGLGVAFTGGADAPGYLCRGTPYKRGTATSALVEAPDDPATLARRFAAEFGRSFYTSTAGQGPRVTLSGPRTVEIGDATGAVVEAVSTTPLDDGCLATRGRTLVLAVPVPAGGTALLVANADTVGGPATPPLVPPSTVEDILGTAAVPTR